MRPNKTVLLFPTNAVGHIHATVAIADKLKKDHNYRTVFMTIGPTIGVIKDHGHELVELEENVVGEEEAGYKKMPLLTSMSQEAYSSGNVIESFLVITNWLGNVVLRELIDHHDAIERAIKKIQPDLIIIDYFVAPPCLVENQQQCPWVNVRSMQPLGVMRSARADNIKPPAYLGAKLYTKLEREAMVSKEPKRWLKLLKSWKETEELVGSKFKFEFRAMAEFYESRGLVFEGTETNSPSLNIYLYPAALDYDQDDDLLVYPPSWFRCESLGRHPGSQMEAQAAISWMKKLEEAMQNKKQMVYLSLGTIANTQEDLMRKFIDFLADDDERLYVVSKGANGDKFELNSSNMIGANCLPQTFFLERAKLAIIQGGSSEIIECVYYGVPMIVLPMYGDQLDNAQRVQDLGLGCRLNLYHCSKRELRDAIERLSGDFRLANKLRSISKRLQSSDDLDKVSFLLKTLIEDKCLDEELIRQCRT